ncbi:MAG TPA: Wzz/FepE/Etk N-terminal domain-containing protein [Solirubrobacteraceae bacterium]|nr:Wzz/FepE/Etk N-terminal domain-containing protein [Solirubrobacteraceae bacterium]
MPGSDGGGLPSWLAPQGPQEGLKHYAEVVRERLRLIIACVIVATAVAGVYVKVAPKTYKAEAHLLVTPVNGETNLVGLGLITNSGTPTGDVSTAASLVATSEVATIVASKVPRTTARGVLGQVSAVPVAESNVVAITATASSAERAQRIANAFALGTVENRTQDLHHELDTIIPTLREKVSALPYGQRTGQGSLGERLAALEALQAGPDPTITVASLAQRPVSPSSPRTKLTLIAGVLAGLLIGIGAAFALDGLDPRIRREETLRRIFRLPVLARVPRERRGSGHHAPLRPDEVSEVALESYRMLRVALGIRGFSGRRFTLRDARSVMVTGSSSSEGKSTVALNFASALASAGNRVILIETDLRRPSLGAALQIHPRHGITGVLMEDIELEDALIPVDGSDGDLSVLLVDQAGPFLADGLLAKGSALVEKAKALADYVIVDAPPVTEVSDAVPLSQHVDDVVVVARLGHSRADRLVNLGEILARQGVRPTGLVIVGDDFWQRGGYYMESSPRQGRLRRRSRRHVPAVET